MLLSTREAAEKLSKLGHNLEGRDVAKLTKKGVFPNAHKDSAGRWLIPSNDLDYYLGIQKIVRAFKGLISTSRFESLMEIHKDLEEKYTATSYTLEDGNDTLQLWYENKSYKRILDLIDEFFPGQIDRQWCSQSLLMTLVAWLNSRSNLRNKKAVESAVIGFISNVENEIKPRLIYIPVEGLKIESHIGLSLGNCTLFDNNEDSEFKQVLDQYRKRLKDENLLDTDFFERVTSFFTYKIAAHYQRGIQRGVEEARLSLSILRLYLASYYFHERHGNVVYRMGLTGSLHRDEQLKVFFINPDVPILDQFPGSRMERTIQKGGAELDSAGIDHLRANGLEKINRLLCSLDLSDQKNDLARRMLRAITWFAKATTARNIADSYLMYAIAIEGLLSEDRTPQETYATQMAALVTGTKDNLILPVGGYISTEFANQLKEANSINDRFNLTRTKIMKLFNYRNRIAHGAVLSNEVDDRNLLDFETLVKNSILSFAVNEWETLGEFKLWVNSSVRLDFDPSH